MLSPLDFLFFAFAFLIYYYTNLFLLLHFSNQKRVNELKEFKKLPTLSILIPAHNEEKNLGKTLKNLKRLSYPRSRLEIIVIDNASTDKTFEVARKHCVKVLRIEEKGKAKALNIGLRHARGEIIGCMDADSFASRDALLKMVGFFQDPKVGAVTPSIRIQKPKSLLAKFQSLEYLMILWNRKLLDFISSVYVTPGVLSLYRKDVLLQLGGFDEQSMTEDIEIAWRIKEAGYEIRMCYPATTFTRPPLSFKAWWRQRIRWNIGGLQTLLKFKHTIFNPRYGRLGTFISPFFLIGLCISLLGFSVFAWVWGNWIVERILLVQKYLEVGTSPLRSFEFVFLPNVYTYFGITIFSISLLLIATCFRSTGARIGGLKGLLCLLLYLTIYLPLFPINLIHACAKCARRVSEW